MNSIKNIAVFIFVLVVLASCKKDVDNLKVLDNVKAPTNVNAIFDITQDNTGVVTIIPTAEGVTEFFITFGDATDEKPTTYAINEVITHTYTEGVFTVGITASGLTGLTSKIEKELNVTFKAPENLVVTIVPDAINPKTISVTATADYATIMEIYFGEVTGEEPVKVLPGEAALHTYAEAGNYVVRVVAKSGGSATVEHSETVTISAASDPVTLPITFESYTVNYSFVDFGNEVTSVVDNPDASGINNSARVAQSIKTTGAETWAGTLLTLASPIDFTAKKLIRVKVLSPKRGVVVKFKIENLNNADINAEVDVITTTSNEWEELTFDFSGIDLGQEYQKVVMFFDFGNTGDDATYYFDDIKQASAAVSTGIVGTWKIKPEAGSLGVGPELGDISWWAIDAAGVEARACFYDDDYIFGADGSFSNVLGTETWIEGWQGGSDACGTPVAPHDGSAVANYTYDAAAGTVTLNGVGAYLGIAKAYNGGELTTPSDAPESITYQITFSDEETVMTLDINIGGGWWRFILVKDGTVVSSPLDGTWKIAPEAGSLGVGPELGDISWWAIDAAGVEARACFYDDEYIFGSDGSFSNVLGTETWVEGWQGGTDACGAPVAPHDGSASATFAYDADAGTVTINGVGAYLGIPKAYNGGELTTPADAPETITYNIALEDENTRMTLDINIGGGWWRFILVKN
ncbi:MAG: hypothetical protein COW63_03245 [Bacteroidetes bacterium CG18_big_fil_WC_8_21_14_2_50_41_14]|nr:MAG: hypothetical protein COW63_03245 [Bacteroidetes bacterium CG18_big_fil_WC_8_21_14_2_50_41_14]PJB59437.1 MAG: hypothetical protein CO098_03345 [Bacteroidetes bacterium CG_4_9_14_3_um_filter_41_19]